MAAIHPEIDVLTARILALDAFVAAMDGVNNIVLTAGAQTLTMEPSTPAYYNRTKNMLIELTEMIEAATKNQIVNKTMTIAQS
jgi:hypothetical protein